MLIVCPSCATSYRVEPASLGEAGRPVRCVRCRNVWFASDSSVLPDMIVVEDTEPEAASQSACEPVCDPSESPIAPPAPAEADKLLALSTFDIGSPEAMTELSREDAPTAILEWPEALPQEALPRGQAPAVGFHPQPTPAQQDYPVLPADAWRGEHEPSGVRRIRQQTRQDPCWSVPFVPIAFGVLVALHGALIGWRAEVVKAVPQTAAIFAAIGLPVNLRGLTFVNVTTVTQMHEGVPVLLVEGAIASTSSYPVEVPRLRLSIRNGKGHEVYAWTELPERSVLAPREILAFRSRLASPPLDARDVVVRFFNRNDLLPGIRHAAAQTTPR